MTAWLLRQARKQSGTRLGTLLFALVVVVAWFIRRREHAAAKRRSDEAAKRQVEAFRKYAEVKREGDLIAATRDRRLVKKHIEKVKKARVELATAKSIDTHHLKRVRELRRAKLTEYANQIIESGGL